jgi:hypothetical protein
LGWLSFLQAFAFYAWLRGCGITYDTLPDGVSAFGLSDGTEKAVCWVGAKHWMAAEEAGHEMGKRTWRAFLEAGAPWPTEFRLRAGVGPLPEPSGREGTFRRGPFCWQTWELIEPRDRPGGIEG